MTTRFYSPFETGDTVWNPTHWTTTVTNTSAGADVLSGEGRMFLPNGTGRYVLAVDNYAATANQEVVLKIRGDQSTSRNNLLVVGVAMSNMLNNRPQTPTDGVYVRINGNSNTFTLVNYRAGASVGSAALTAGRAAFNSTFWLRLKRIDNTVYVRTWADGATEPGTWNDTVDISGYATLPAGKVVIGVETTSSTSAAESYYFDEITSTDANDGPVSTNGGYTAQAMTASALVNDPSARGNVVTSVVASDRHIKWSGSAYTYHNTNPIEIGGYGADFKIPAEPTLSAGEGIVSKKLVLTAYEALAATTLAVATINADWTEGVYGASVTGDTTIAPPDTSVTTISVPALSAGQTFEIDLTGISHPYGIRLRGGSSRNFYSGESATSPAYVKYVIAAQVPNTVPALPATASAEMPDPAIYTTSGERLVAVQPMTASAEVLDARAGQVLRAAPMEASASLENAVASVISNIFVAAEAATVSAQLPGDITVNGDSVDVVGDRYYERIAAQDPRTWLRLNQQTGTTLPNAGNAYPDNAIHADIFGGVTLGKPVGPAGRIAATFNGSGYIKQREFGSTRLGGAEDTDSGSSLQFSFRTTKKNQLILADFSEHDWDAGRGGYTVELADGKIKISHTTWGYTSAGGVGPTTVTWNAFTDVADGKWHTVHIVNESEVRLPQYSNAVSMTGLYIDGKLEFQRINQRLFSGYFPDYIGGVPTSGAETPTNWFVGEMSEIVLFRPALTPNKDGGASLAADYRAFMGWNPIVAEAMTANAASGDHKAKGNRARVLLLKMGNIVPPSSTEPAWTASSQSEVSMGYHHAWDWKDKEIYNLPTNAEDFLFETPETYIIPVGLGETFPREFTEFGMIFAKSVANNYRDERTDMPRLIDLNKDIDLDDFDVIMVDSWPFTSDLISKIESLYGDGAMERFAAQFVDVVSQGKNLVVTHPQMAMDMGIAKDVDWAPSMQEWDWRLGPTYDWEGTTRNTYINYPLGKAEAEIWPWPVYNQRGEVVLNRSEWLSHSHHNNRFRVVSEVEGLTDIPSFMIAESIRNVGADFWTPGSVYGSGWYVGTQGLRRGGMRYLNRSEEGLTVGDEFLFMGASKGGMHHADGKYWGQHRPIWHYYGVNDDFPLEYQTEQDDRYLGGWAIPPGALVVGQAVTTFASTVWIDGVETVNPYRNHITSAVILPGTMLGNKIMRGRIFVSITESPVVSEMFLPKQFLKSGKSSTETAAQNEWDWSMERGTSSASNYDIRWVNHLGITARGIRWLLQESEVSEGDIIINAQSMEASAFSRNAVVTANKGIVVRAEAARATATLVQPANYEADSVKVVALPLYASARMTGMKRTIKVAPLRAHAEMGGRASGTAANVEQVVVYLHNTVATLFIKEEA